MTRTQLQAECAAIKADMQDLEDYYKARKQQLQTEYDDAFSLLVNHKTEQEAEKV